MCVVVAVYSESVGSWILGKNRDRPYKPKIRIRKSFRNGVERLYLWDERTRYTEGVNEFGIGIISASVMVKDDEAEGGTAAKEGIKQRTFYSPDGLRIRTALFEKTLDETLEKLIELEIPGNTILADKDRCIILEGAFENLEDQENYVYKSKEVLKNQVVVRTNHGILLDWTGYKADVPEQADARFSSETRYEKVAEKLVYAQNLNDVMEILSTEDDINPQLNPLRRDTKRLSMRTTGQIFVIPGQHSLLYRSIWGDASFDLNSLNKDEEKCSFDIVSTKKLLSFKESLDGH